MINFNRSRMFKNAHAMAKMPSLKYTGTYRQRFAQALKDAYLEELFYAEYEAANFNGCNARNCELVRKALINVVVKTTNHGKTFALAHIQIKNSRAAFVVNTEEQANELFPIFNAASRLFSMAWYGMAQC